MATPDWVACMVVHGSGGMGEVHPIKAVCMGEACIGCMNNQITDCKIRAWPIMLIFAHKCSLLYYSHASYQGLIDLRSGERAWNSAYACRDGKMLVVTKNRTKPNAWAGGEGSCADLQAVGALEFFGELCSLAEGFGPFLRGVWAKGGFYF